MRAAKWRGREVRGGRFGRVVAGRDEVVIDPAVGMD